MTKFAEGTTVSVEKTMMEIQATLRRYNASKFMYGEDGDRIAVVFEMHKRRVKFVMPLPAKNEAAQKSSNQFGCDTPRPKGQGFCRTLALTCARRHRQRSYVMRHGRVPPRKCFSLHAVDIYWGDLFAPPPYQILKEPRWTNAEAILLLSFNAQPYERKYSTNEREKQRERALSSKC